LPPQPRSARPDAGREGGWTARNASQQTRLDQSSLGYHHHHYCRLLHHHHHHPHHCQICCCCPVYC
jgi:hypothetical protein